MGIITENYQINIIDNTRREETRSENYHDAKVHTSKTLCIWYQLSIAKFGIAKQDWLGKSKKRMTVIEIICVESSSQRVDYWHSYNSHHIIGIHDVIFQLARYSVFQIALYWKFYWRLMIVENLYCLISGRIKSQP